MYRPRSSGVGYVQSCLRKEVDDAITQSIDFTQEYVEEIFVNSIVNMP